MKHPIKLWLKKQLETRPGWWHYVPLCWFTIDDYNPDFTNETDMCRFIYNKYGPGRYQVLAFQKGYKGVWCYWLGNLYDNGYIRDSSKNVYIERMKKEMQKDISRAATYEERREIEDNYSESIEIEKEIAKELKAGKRRGPYGIETMRANVFHSYNEYPDKFNK